MKLNKIKIITMYMHVIEVIDGISREINRRKAEKRNSRSITTIGYSSTVIHNFHHISIKNGSY